MSAAVCARPGRRSCRMRGAAASKRRIDMRVHPKISVVIPSYNQGRYLEETLCSVLDQGYRNLELIVIDGGSIDDSVDIIAKYAAHIDYWISEPDGGRTLGL